MSMCIVRSQESVRQFYTAALVSGVDTIERLGAPVTDRFAAFLNSVGDESPRTAVDLGYGKGVYTVVLARTGYHVVGVDQVPTTILQARLAGCVGWRERIALVQQRIEHFTPIGDLGVMVAKDVLHYLTRDQVHELLWRCRANAVAGSCHYLEVFVDITRLDSVGCRVRIEGEADYTKTDFCRMLAEVYRDWHVTAAARPHVDKDAYTGTTCFRATRITVACRNNRGRR